MLCFRNAMKFSIMEPIYRQRSTEIAVSSFNPFKAIYNILKTRWKLQKYVIDTNVLYLSHTIFVRFSFPFGMSVGGTVVHAIFLLSLICGFILQHCWPHQFALSCITGVTVPCFRFCCDCNSHSLHLRHRRDER